MELHSWSRFSCGRTNGRMDVFQEVLADLKRSGFNMKEIISLVLADDG